MCVCTRAARFTHKWTCFSLIKPAAKLLNERKKVKTNEKKKMKTTEKNYIKSQKPSTEKFTQTHTHLRTCTHAQAPVSIWFNWIDSQENQAKERTRECYTFFISVGFSGVMMCLTTIFLLITLCCVALRCVCVCVFVNFPCVANHFFSLFCATALRGQEKFSVCNFCALENDSKNTIAVNK